MSNGRVKCIMPDKSTLGGITENDKANELT